MSKLQDSFGRTIAAICYKIFACICFACAVAVMSIGMPGVVRCSPHAPVQSKTRSSLPERIEFIQGHAYMGSERLAWENGRLTSVKRYANLDGKGGFREVVEQFNPSPRAWERFWKSMDAAGVWRWRDHYTSAASSQQDGDAWRLELRHNGRRLKSGGYNAQPPNYGTFYSALNQLLKEGKGERNKAPHPGLQSAGGVR